MATHQEYVSDELTHFVAKEHKECPDEQFKILCKILREGKLLGGGKKGAQGNMTMNPRADLSSNEFIAPEMVCFCDIPIESLGVHMRKYGQFAISFAKLFMRAEGCNPVYYISKGSPCTDHKYINENDPSRETKWGDFFSRAADEWLPGIKRKAQILGKPGHIDPSKLDRIENLLLWYVFGHLKFFDITLPKDHPQNFYMEREWRKLGNIDFKLADVKRVILPCGYEARFRSTFKYTGTITRVCPDGSVIV